MTGLVLLAVVALAVPPPPHIDVSTGKGVQRIQLRNDEAVGPLVPLAALVRAVGGSVTGRDSWITWTVDGIAIRILAGSPVVGVGESVRMLPASSVQRGDSVWVPLAMVTEVVADPRRGKWHWIPTAATLAAGPGPSVMMTPVSTPRPAAPPVNANGLSRVHRVTIDPGHGGSDPGSPGLHLPAGMAEKHVTLSVGFLVRDELERRGVKVTMTRTTDTLINLGHRAPRYCRDDCDLFVSLHVNDLDPRPGYTNARGFETYFQAEARSADAARVAAMENEAIRFEVEEEEVQATGLDFILKDLQANEFLRESARAAALIQEHLAKVHSGPNRGVKQANFAVLNTARRPAVLVELGFGTNREDARILSGPQGQRDLARAVADAIMAYLREYENRVGVNGGGVR